MEPVHELSGYADARRIDLLCDDFEARWAVGERPRIEDLVVTLPEPLRGDGLRALLSVEVELRAGEAPALADYRARFPAQQDLVTDVFAAASSAVQPNTSMVGGDAATRSFPDGPTPEPPPTVIDRFEVLGVLGEGAFGTVYKARDPKLDREVAIKVPKSAALGPGFDRERFLREARTAARLRHPNVCPVYEVGMNNNRLFIVMAFVEGETLAEHLKSRKTPLPPRQVAQLVRRLALALQAAHEKGIVHRDLKPGNVLIDRERSDVVITDFGLARLAERDGGALQTQSGLILGTPAYMAPEQARGDVRAIGPACDVYSLGVILYELLCERRPFSGTAGEVIGQVLHVEPAPPSAVRPDVDSALEAMCRKAMAKDPAARYLSMRALADELGAYLRGRTSAAEPMPAQAASSAPVSAPPALQEVIEELVAVPTARVEVGTRSSTPVVVTGTRRRRWRWLVAGGLLGLLMLGGVLVLSPKPTNQGPPPGTVKGDSEPPAPAPDGWVTLFNGKDLTGWHVALDDGTPVEAARNPWQAGDGEIVFSLPGGTVERFNLTSEREFADFRLRFEFQADDKIRAGVRLRAAKEHGKGQGGTGLVWIGDTFPFLKTGYFMYAPQSRQHLLPDPRPQLRPAGEWNVMEIDLQGQRQQVFINGQNVLDFDREELSKRPQAMSGLTRPQGVIKLLGSAGTMRLRKVAVKEYSPRRSADPDRVAAEWVLKIGGLLTIDQGNGHVPIIRADDLPATPFHVVRCWMPNNKNVTDDGLSALRGVTGALDLNFDGTSITDAGLAHLKDCRGIWALHLRSTKISDDGLKHLSGMTKLQELWLDGTPLTGTGLVHLKGLPALVALGLSGTKIIDDSLQHLAALPLQGLQLRNTGVTDAGLARLQDVKNLVEVQLENCKVTDAGVAKLQQARPDLKITR